MGKFRKYLSGSGNVSLTISQRGLFEKKHFSSLPRARKPLYSGQKSFLRPYSPLIGLYLYWKVDFRFGHQKCLNRGRGKVYFHIQKWTFPLLCSGTSGARYKNLRALFNTPQTGFWPKHLVLAWDHPYDGHRTMKQGVFNVFPVSCPQTPFVNTLYFDSLALWMVDSGLPNQFWKHEKRTDSVILLLGEFIEWSFSVWVISSRGFLSWPAKYKLIFF